MRSFLVSCIALDFAFAAGAIAGPYSPQAGVAGSTAISASSSSIVEWASGVSNLTRGPQNISSAGSAPASYGTSAAAIGIADNSVVSLGDGGSITVTFDKAITNRSGADFAVYENAFTSGSAAANTFAELGFVEVSSDGVNFTRFASTSLTQTATQVGGFGLIDPTDINNLAGQFITGYGTPFDLNELAGTPGLDINNITAVRVIDVVGSINALYGSKDSNGNLINDPFTTPYASSGFDLDAVGVLNAVPEPASLATLLTAGIAMLRRRRA